MDEIKKETKTKIFKKTNPNVSHLYLDSLRKSENSFYFEVIVVFAISVYLTLQTSNAF